MAVKLDYLEGLQFKAYSEDAEDYSILLDTSRENGGGGSGMKPTDMLLVSVGGCSSMDIVSILKKKRQEIISYSVTVEGERSQEHPRVFTKIWLKYEIKGKNIEEAAVRRAIELSKDKYCSVWAMLCKAAEIEWSYKIENE